MCPSASTRSLMLGPRAPNAAPAPGTEQDRRLLSSYVGMTHVQQLLQGVQEANLPLATGSEGL